MKVVLACALVASLAVAPTWPAKANGARASTPFSRGILFRLDKPGVAPSYVFGTVHSGDPRVTTLAPPVRDALALARTFALEIRLGEGDVAEFFEAAQFDDGRRLGDFFDPPTVAAIRFALAGVVPDDATLTRLKPWAILLKLAEQPAAASDSGETLDRALLETAIQRKLGIIGLESPEEQLATFDAIPLATQVALVRMVLADREGLHAQPRENRRRVARPGSRSARIAQRRAGKAPSRIRGTPRGAHAAHRRRSYDPYGASAVRSLARRSRVRRGRRAASVRRARPARAAAVAGLSGPARVSRRP